jgi:hypothetical protein
VTDPETPSLIVDPAFPHLLRTQEVAAGGAHP